MSLIDSHGRKISYLRLSVTDRCNLRCFYCMPEEGIDYVPRTEILSYEEILRLCRVLSGLGISKLRITGGEPFVRKDLMFLIRQLSEEKLFREIHITTNGVLTGPYIPELSELGLSGINLSLDTLDRDQFLRITKRDKLDAVKATMDRIIEYGIPLKINMVVMKGLNTRDIKPMAELTREHNVEVRFLEEMPFNGTGLAHEQEFLSYRDIRKTLQEHYPGLQEADPVPGKTARLYQVPGYAGSLGIIASFSRTFCGTCDRIRLTPVGQLKTCLYDQKGLNFRDILRSGIDDDRLAGYLVRAVKNKYADGFEAENDRESSIATESMATIGG